MKYLFIFENGSFKQYDKYTEDDVKMVAEGYCEIIKKDKYKDNFEVMLSNGEWEPVFSDVVQEKHDGN